MEAPDWFTSDYVEKALCDFHKDASVKVMEMQMNAALGKGENFGAVLTRVQVQYKLNNGKDTLRKAFVLKTSYEDDEFAIEKMKPYDIFNREMSIYQDILPKLNALLKEINDEDELFPTAVYIDFERQAILFEDLNKRGFVMADRIKGLDLDHIYLILRKLAKMHATSAVLNERENKCLESYDRGFFNRYTDNYSPYFVGSLVACGEFVQKYMGEKYAYYAQKILALAPHYMEIGKRCFAPTPDHINVLAHGDVWTNNVMFKYDEKTNRPIDVLLIDFQYAFWGSPALDLHHFFNTSLKEDLRLYKQDMLFQNYHKIFTETLRKLNYRSHPITSLRQFRLQVEQKRFFAFHSSCVVQPVMINEDPKDADFNALMGEDERALNFKRRLYTNNKRVAENLKNLLPLFDHRGLLEINQSDG